MHWSAILLMAVAGPNSGMEVAHTASSETYSSYTQAWHAAHDAERPMLVILNPAAGQGTKLIAPELLSDNSVKPLLNDYIVAVIDTGTEDGKQVHQLFENAPLPRVVVIDKDQKEQIYRASGEVSAPQLAKVLDEHKDGEVAAPQIKVQTPVSGGCPNCQRRYVYPSRR